MRGMNTPVTAEGGSAVADMGRLTPGFFARDTVTVARELLGKYLVRVLDGQPLVLRIAETEAYVGRRDRACHAWNYRRTARTETLFAPPGTVYIYLIYGMYHCLNLVTEEEGEPAAVLIRAGQPRHNFDILAENRFGRKWGDLSPAQRRRLCDGPGKLCRALSLTRAENGIALGKALFVADSLSALSLPPWPGDGEPPRIAAGPRIGVDYAGEDALLPWRFTLTDEGGKYVSL